VWSRMAPLPNSYSPSSLFGPWILSFLQPRDLKAYSLNRFSLLHLQPQLRPGIAQLRFHVMVIHQLDQRAVEFPGDIRTKTPLTIGGPGPARGAAGGRLTLLANTSGHVRSIYPCISFIIMPPTSRVSQ